MLKCIECGATAEDNSKERARFERRHPKLCVARRRFNEALAEGVRSVESEPVEGETRANG